MGRAAEAALLALAAAAGGLGGAVLAQDRAPAAEPSERVIKVVARRFVFNPSEIVLKKGRPVVFELSTLDFGHGFSIPDLDFRADFVPDKVSVVRLTPQKTGKFEFLCDNFCGSGHEEMDGHMIVEE
jgi:cytochrome c oxidase subunit II